MSGVPTCPCCFGILDAGQYKLTSACRCGFPETVTWDNFPVVEPVTVQPRLPDRRYANLHQRCAAGTITADETAELDRLTAAKINQAAASNLARSAH